MSKALRILAIVGVGVWVRGVAFGQPHASRMATKTKAGQLNTSYVSKPLLTRSVRPQQYGTQDYVVTVVSASRFYRSYNGSNLEYATLSGHCYYDCPSGYHLYQQVEVPAGAVIDYIGVNTSTTVDAAMGFTLHFRDHLGGSAELVSSSVPAHANFSTDFVGPLGIQVPDNLDRVFILDIEQAPLQQDSTQQFFGYFEVWWRRTVSDPPATPTFGDVPASHPFYQFIEALAASGITGGCGDGSNYCPEAPLTRGQTAVFLAKALGLHWPN